MKFSYAVLIALIALPLLAPKCNNQEATKKVEEKAEATQALVAGNYADKASEKVENYADSLLVRYQRNACFGTCPVDVTEIYASGLIVNTPRANGVVEKPSMAWLNAEQISFLKAVFNDNNFFGLEAEYDSGIPDLPGSRYFFRTKDQSKEILVKSGNPTELRPIAKGVVSLLEEIADWKALPVSK